MLRRTLRSDLRAVRRWVKEAVEQYREAKIRADMASETWQRFEAACQQETRP